MDANPRLAVLLARYAQFDRLTLILAGIALAAVLLGWALTRPGDRKLDRLYRELYLGSLALVFILTLAGTFLLLRGGS